LLIALFVLVLFLFFGQYILKLLQISEPSLTVAGGIIFLSSGLRRYLGERGLIAMERLMGMILTTIAVQMLLTGIKQFLK
jgi:small neutral amino acid transporter SnatA (MarC family)